jgi:hypothetical protein
VGSEGADAPPTMMAQSYPMLLSLEGPAKTQASEEEIGMLQEERGYDYSHHCRVQSKKGIL